MPPLRESRSRPTEQEHRSSGAKPPVAGGLAGLQRAIGNQATVGLLADARSEGAFDTERYLLAEQAGLSAPNLLGHLRDATLGGDSAADGPRRSAFGAPSIAGLSIGASPTTIARWPWSKKKSKSEPQITPEQARDIQKAIADSPEMQHVEEIRASGSDDAEDRALAALESFWDTGEVEIKGEKIKLAQFKPLMFTASERRVRQINQIRTASNVRAGFKSAVDQGRVDPTKTETPLKLDPKSQAKQQVSGGPGAGPKKPTASSLPPGTGVVGTIGDTGGGVSKVSGYGTDIGSHFQDPTQGAGMSETAKLLDTKYNNPNDPMYGGPPSFESKSDWAGGIISIVQGAFGLLSNVATLIKSKDKSGTEQAEAGANLASTVTTTAGNITEAVQNIQGSDVTTNMFHWVPGLSVISNAFSAIKSALALAPKAVQLDSLRKNGAKVKSDDKDREDVKLAVSRLAVRSAQQVEQESFAVAKSLTNAGLSLAEVVTAGGFGIPRLASVVLDGVGVLHSVGHAIADFIRANATGKARTDYFGAHKTGSAEKLLNTDPAFAADAILSRATEGDAQALAILKAFDIKVPAIGGAKLVKTITVAGKAGKNENNKERQIDYDFDAIGEYDAAKAKLIEAIKPEKTVGETVDEVTSVLTERTEGLAAAKRLAEVRNEIKMKGKSDRGSGYNALGFFKGKSGLKKSIDKTEKAIREDKSIPPEKKEALILKLKGMKPPIQAPDGQISRPYDDKTFQEALSMDSGKLALIIMNGSSAVGGPGPKWEAYMAAYTNKMSQKAG